MSKLYLYLVFFFLPLLNEPKAEVNIKKENKTDSYSSLNLQEKGLSKAAFDYALGGLKKLETKGQLRNPDLLTIADYSQPSNNKRLYVIDLKQNKLLYNTYVAHGRNTGDLYATSFSNRDGSLKSSLGFYITGQTILASHTGYSLLLNGVEKGFNDHALQRAIIMHGADYATEGFIKKYGRLGRSLGCPALPPDLSKTVIETIKEGSCLFIYNPDHNYITGSDLIN